MWQTSVYRRKKTASKTLGAHALSIASPPSRLQWRKHGPKRRILYTSSVEARMSMLCERPGGEKASDAASTSSTEEGSPTIALPAS
ncbi:MAG: hypothetical protein ACLPSW_20870 [Roseiarcus sp.]